MALEMKVYLNITLLSGYDIGLSFLWGKVFQQVHLAITENLDESGKSKIGVSFPQYCSKNISLGKKLRLFSINEESLEQLNIVKWLDRLSDYVHITSIRNVPRNIFSHSCYKRERTKSNLERIVRRKARRKGISESEARESFGDFKERHSRAPFINMHSLGSGQKFKLFIIKEKAECTMDGYFGSYGLGISGSVPEF